MNQYNTNEILQKSLDNVSILKDHLDKIDELRNDIKSTIIEAQKIPKEFKKFTLDIDNTSNLFIQKNYDLLKEQILFFQEKLIDLNNRIVQIDEIDFNKKFEKATEEFFKNFNQTKKRLDESITRIEQVDLEKHFLKHDKTLSDIFAAINNISTSLVTLSNQLNNFQNKIIDLEKQTSNIELKIENIDKKINNLELKINDIEINIGLEINKLNEKMAISQKLNKTNHNTVLAILIIILIVTISLKFI